MRIQYLPFFIVFLFLMNVSAYADNFLYDSQGTDKSESYFDEFTFETTLEEGLKMAFELHKQAKDFDGELKAVQSFVKLSDQFSSEWLPAYWASYLYTQLANIMMSDNNMVSEDITMNEMIEKSQEYLDIAKTRKKEMDAVVEAEFHNLAGLIYFFQARTSEIEDKKDEFLKARTESISKAIQLAPDNPNSQVMAATELIRYGYLEKDLQKILAGKLLLENADEIYKKTTVEMALSTYWAQDFVNYWLNFANNSIQNL